MQLSLFIVKISLFIVKFPYINFVFIFCRQFVVKRERNCIIIATLMPVLLTL